MSELKPCPFCGGEAIIKQYKNAIDKDDRPIGGWFVDCEDCGCGTLWHNTEAKAVVAWNRRPAEPNEPLTLEELRGMDGEPVWIDGKDYGGWTIFKAGANKQVAICLDNVNLSYYMADYSKTWIAYRRKPESEEV